jgi:hypothetical protein
MMQTVGACALLIGCVCGIEDSNQCDDFVSLMDQLLLLLLHTDDILNLSTYSKS